MNTQILLVVAMLALQLVGGLRSVAATATATCPANLVIGEVFDCSISAGGEVDSYSFSAKQNDRWYFNIHRTAGALQPYIEVVDQYNNRICYDYTYGSDTNITCNITTNGTFSFRVNDRYGPDGRTGTYIVYGQRANTPSKATPIDYGKPIDASLDYAIEDDYYSFQATINDKIIARVLRTSGNMQPTMYILDSKGVQLCGNYTYSAYVGLECDVTKTDTYYILIGERTDTATGNYTLHIQRKNNPGNATTLQFGVPLKGSLNQSAALNTYSFTASANDHAFLRAQRTSGTLQPTIYVFNQSGATVCGDYTYSSLVHVDCAIPANGTYTVFVDDRSDSNIGEYTLVLQRTNTPGQATSITFGQTVQAAIEEVAAFNTYTFTGQQGDKLNLTLTRTAGSVNFAVYVYNPAGEQICYNYYGDSPFSLNNCALTNSGTHTILVFDRDNDAVGTYSMELKCASGFCGTAALNGSKLFLPLMRR